MVSGAHSGSKTDKGQNGETSLEVMGIIHVSDDSDLDQGTAVTVVGNSWILDVF